MSDYEAFLDTVLESLAGVNIDIVGKLIDHIGYRATSLENYHDLKSQLAPIATLINEIIINNRPIAVFKFHEPLVYKSFNIPYIEVLAPAPNGRQFPEGLEHIEVVADKPLEMTKCYPNLNWKVTEGRIINPEAILQFEKYAVKFHPLPVADAMREQLAHGIL